MVARPEAILAAQSGGLLHGLRRYWFLGLFSSSRDRRLSRLLARGAWMVWELVVLGTAVVYGLWCVRTSGRSRSNRTSPRTVSRVRWLPAFGTALQTAIVHFQCQNRVPQRAAPRHPRVLLGIGFALTIIGSSFRAGSRLRRPRRQRVAGDERASARLEHRDDGVRGVGREARIRDAP